MTMFYRRCPCCNVEINKLLFHTKPSKYKTNYKCCYCPKCKEQISDGYHAKFEPMFGAIFVFFSFMLSKITVELFEFLPNIPDPIKIMLLFLLYGAVLSLVAIFVYISFVALKCYEEKDGECLEKAELCNQALDDFFEIESEVKITPFEKKMKRHMVLSPLHYGVVVIVGVWLLIWFD